MWWRKATARAIVLPQLEEPAAVEVVQVPEPRTVTVEEQLEALVDDSPLACIFWARDSIDGLYTALGHHLTEVHECDAHCLPVEVEDWFARLDKNDLVELLSVLIKDQVLAQLQTQDE